MMRVQPVQGVQIFGMDTQLQGDQQNVNHFAECAVI